MSHTSELTARDLMTPDPGCIDLDASLTDAAVLLRDLDVGVLPICGPDGKLAGMLTDRDIVVRCLADGGDPASTQVSALAQGVPITVEVSASLAEVVAIMSENQIRRLPVLAERQLVGIIAQADVARARSDAAGELVEDVSQP